VKNLLRLLFVTLALAAATFAAEIKVATLNCYLLFDPAIDHPGKVDDQNRMTAAQYRTKLENLASLAKGFDVVGLQETGGRPEVEALAKAAGMSWAWTRGKDTATGEEVALLYRLPGWKVTRNGRVGELDRVLSKHLLVTATKGEARVHVLVVHLIRPIGAQAAKHEGQLKAVGAWMQGQLQRDPGSTVVVLGDTNNSETGKPLFGLGSEAGELNGFAATHLTGKCFDRLVVAGTGRWAAVETRRPPYGPRPNDANKKAWTDHYLVGATLVVP
jgi:hypothetical protein